jgi:hypothetical protein
MKHGFSGRRWTCQSPTQELKAAFSHRQGKRYPNDGVDTDINLT